jgi:hypothetical protein
MRRFEATKLKLADLFGQLVRAQNVSLRRKTPGVALMDVVV